MEDCSAKSIGKSLLASSLDARPFAIVSIIREKKGNRERTRISPHLTPHLSPISSLLSDSLVDRGEERR